MRRSTWLANVSSDMFQCQPYSRAPMSNLFVFLCAVRDALAEARGCVRIVLKVRPLLASDVLAASHSGVQLRAIIAAWAGVRAAPLGAAPAARGREAEAALAAMPLHALAAVLGCSSSPVSLAALPGLIERAAAMPGAADVGGGDGSRQLSAVDISPAVVTAGSSLDGGKQFVIAPAPLSLQDLGAAVLRAAQAESAVPPSQALAEALLPSIRRGVQFQFDRIYGAGGSDDADVDLATGARK